MYIISKHFFIKNGINMNKPSSNFTMFQNIITNPITVFESIKLKNSFMLPLLISSLLLSILIFFYFQQVDPVWIVNFTLDPLTEDMAPDQISQLKKVMTPTSLRIMAIAASVVGVFITPLLQSLYLLVVGNIKDLDISFGEWFSLTSWSSVPTLFATVLMLINLNIGDNSQVPIELINPVNFVNIFTIEESNQFYNLFSSLSLFAFWNLYLIVSGLKYWSGFSWKNAVVTIAIPYLIIFIALFYFS